MLILVSKILFVSVCVRVLCFNWTEKPDSTRVAHHTYQLLGLLCENPKLKCTPTHLSRQTGHGEVEEGEGEVEVAAPAQWVVRLEVVERHDVRRRAVQRLRPMVPALSCRRREQLHLLC